MLYIDSADRDLLAPLLATGLFAGVTTNPAILDRAGLTADDLPALATWLRERGVTRFYAQATGTTIEELRDTARQIADLGGDVVIKLVATAPALTVARELTDAGREVLITAVYHPSQALLAAAAGAQEVAPYVGRASENGRDGLALVAAIARSVPSVRILAASLRSADQVAAVAGVGAHDVTLAPSIAGDLFEDELRLAATADFEELVAAAARAAEVPS
ncbi:transaldolase family protein [Microbacterium maritypicum]|uniref:Transaldolase family protein n=1 Tax=Microbacterium maritypicum TaxID=33918 RepID=A0AAJ5VAY9_MICMQ|nr:transaldolase family protein [Microbacterium liquefaciens]WEF20893.1 transaldolase family protein [Microbacterium liquefaciens]